jgi:hypothetical protein
MFIRAVKGVEKETAVGTDDAIAPELSLQHRLAGVERARFAIVIARANIERDSQTCDRAPNELVLLSRTVVGVIAGENGEIDAVGEMLICVLDEREKVAVVGLIFGGDVKVAEVKPADRLRKVVSHDRNVSLMRGNQNTEDGEDERGRHHEHSGA